jgi:cytochrome c-type biogenesis protein
VIESILTALSQGLTGSLLVAVLAAAVRGVASVVLSPCHLAGIPLVVAFASGGAERSVRRAFGMSLVGAAALLGAFAAGHAGVLVAAGTAGEHVQGLLDWGRRSKVRPWVRRVAGAAVAGAGVYAIAV